jgi:ribosome maturation factor RimP
VLDIAGVRRSLPMAELGPGRVQVEFSRPGDAAPGDGEEPDDGDQDEEELDGDLDDEFGEESDHQRNHN